MPLRVIALLLAFLAFSAGPTHAQGLQDRPFSGDERMPSRGWQRDGRFSPFAGTSPYERRLPWGEPFSAVPFDIPQASQLTAYRTLCVRMCDGYYFPISYATDTGGLAHDAQACAAACGSEARLFYHPNPGGNVASMVDLTGRAYASYPTAFRYRKTMVAGCECRPQPWAPSELARHRSYAATQSLRPPRPPDDAVAAPSFEDAPSNSDDAEPWIGTYPQASSQDFDPHPFGLAPVPGWNMLSGFSAAPPPRARASPQAGW